MNHTAYDVLSGSVVSIARQFLYRFAAFSLVDPRLGTWQHLHNLCRSTLVQDAAAVLRSLPQAVPQELSRGERPLKTLRPERVLERLPESSDKFNAEYEETFGLLVSKACPPYETEYIPGKFTFQRSSTLADVAGFYRAYGLRVSRRLPERPDHIVQELEFMAFTIGMEKRALERLTLKGKEQATVCRETQSRFLQEHLAWWVPAFARLLSVENPTGFYAAIGDLLRALIPLERALLGVPIPSQAPAPSTVERPEECEGCQLTEDA